ncbi:Ribonuclease HII [Tenacibaculum litopenaei]|uniref:ribonuclease HII n=1 Tax=Tenacibaculum litopenaei TaxID=396016 RepID=UPI003894AF3E
MLKLRYTDYIHEAGTDEAGRGCLAGPVVAAAVILPPNFKHEFLTDSKQLSEKKRAALRPYIEEQAVAYGVAFIHEKEVDELNVLQASITGMHRALAKLQTPPEFIAVDGNKFKPYHDVPYETLIKGDGRFLNIAAASILAKTYRDEFMEKIHEEFPAYNWQKNKGYPTKEHRNAIREFGPTPYHRKSFKLLPDQLKLSL